MKTLRRWFMSLVGLQRQANSFLYGPLLWLAVCVLAVNQQRDVFENDLFLHLNLGKWILNGGAVSGNPEWTFGPHRDAWYNTLVIPEILMTWLHHALGWWGLSLIQTLCTVGLLLSTWFSVLAIAPSPGKSRHPLAARYALVSAFFIVVVTSPLLSVRPQSVSFVIAPALAVILLRIAHTGRAPHPLAATLGTVAWINIHGYAIFVAPLLCLAALAHIASVSLPHLRSWDVFTVHVRQAFRTLGSRMWLSIAGSALAILVQPAGINFFKASLALRESASQMISEWEAVTPISGLGWLITITLLGWLLDLGLTYLSGQRRPGFARAVIAEGVLLLGLIVAFGFTIRTAVYGFMIGFIIMINRWIRDAKREGGVVLPGEILPQGSRKWTTIVPALMLAVATALLLVEAPHLGIDDRRQPVHLWKAMAAEPGLHYVLADWDTTSGTLYYMLEHDVPGALSLDGRTDRYMPLELLNYAAMMRHGVVPEIFDRYEAQSTDAIITNKGPLRRELKNRGWIERKRQPGLTPDGEPITWLWLEKPSNAR